MGNWQRNHRYTRLTSQASSIQGAAHRMATPIQHMRIDLRRADILVPQQFLHSTDVVTTFKQMRGEGMAQGMAAGRLGYPSAPQSVLDCSLKGLLAKVVTTQNTATRID